MSNNRLMDKIKDIPLLFFTGRRNRPDTLTPTHAGVAASALGYLSVNNHRTNLPLRTIIRRLDIRRCQKSEIILSRFTFESPGQFPGQFMIRRPTHLNQKILFDFFHRAKVALGGQLMSTMQRHKQLFKPFQKVIGPAAKLFNRMLGKETNLSNQMSHAVLQANIKQAGKFAVRAPIVGTNNTTKILAKYFFKNGTAARFINLELTVIRRIKTPCPVKNTLVVMTGFIHINLRLIGQTVDQLIIGGFKSFGGFGSPYKTCLSICPTSSAL